MTEYAIKVYESLLNKSEHLKGDVRTYLRELTWDIGEFPEEYPSAENIIEYFDDMLTESVDCEAISESTKRIIMRIVKLVTKEV